MAFTLTATVAFAAPFAASAAIEFVPASAPDSRQLTLAATLPALSAAIALGRVRQLTLAATLPGLQPVIPLAYDNNVWRGLTAISLCPDRGAAFTQASVGGRWQTAQQATGLQQAHWQGASGLTASVAGGHATTDRLATPFTSRFAAAIPAGFGIGARHQQQAPTDAALRAHWQPAVMSGAVTGFRWIFLRPADREQRAHWQAMRPQDRDWTSAARQGRFTPREWRIPWQAGQPLTGVSWPIPPLPPPPPPPPPPVDIEFLCPFLFIGDIEFVRDCGGTAIRIPLRRVYYVLHDFAFTRVSDGAALDFADLTLSSDIGSWGWSLSGNALGATTYSRLTAAPFTEINIHINGLDWRFLLTSVAHHRDFGKTGYPVTGISPALALTAPLSDARSAAIDDAWTAQQLADLQVADTAWTIDWQAPVWPVPGGVWQYSSQTPLQVISDIASAAGAFVQAERVNRILRVQPFYPGWPWEWGTAAEATWPTAILKNLQQAPKPGQNYNAVYAAGTREGGLMGYVKRAGSAGDRQPGAPITHALITHVDAARAFGGTYLAGQQDQIAVSFDTILGGDAPLAELATRLKLTEPGLPNQTMLTEAVSIRVQRSDKSVTVTQSVAGVAFA